MITKELLNFIKKFRTEGKTDEQIRSVLIEKGGWAPEDVSEAFRAVGPSAPKPAPTPPPVSPTTPVTPAATTIEPALEPAVQTTQFSILRRDEEKPKKHKSMLSKMLLFICILLIVSAAAAFYFRDTLKTWPILHDLYYPRVDAPTLPESQAYQGLN